MSSGSNIISDISGVYLLDPVRQKNLSISKEYMVFSGRDNSNNSSEYARISNISSNQSGNRLIYDSTLVGISAQTTGSETWSVRVRKNGSPVNLSTLSMSSVDGNQDYTLDVDFYKGDSIEVFIDGTGINRPIIKLEFAGRFTGQPVIPPDNDHCHTPNPDLPPAEKLNFPKINMIEEEGSVNCLT